MITPSYSATATERVLPRMALDFTTASLDPRVTVTRALNTATRVNSSGAIEIVNADLPRFDYTLGSGGACKGLLIEETRTNALSGVDCVNPTGITGWTTFGDPAGSLSVVSDDAALAAAGLSGLCSTGKVFKIDNSAGTSPFYARINNSITLGANTWSFTAYVRGSGSFSFDVNAGTWTPGGTSPALTSSYQRLVSIGSSSVSSNQYRVSVTGGSVVYFILMQAEQGAFPTSVIPNTGTSVTRNADVVQMTGTNFSSWYNQTAGAFAVSFDRIAALSASFSGGQPRTLRVTNAGATDFFILGGNSSFGEQLIGRASGVDTVSIQTGIQIAANTVANECFAYALNNFALSVNGAAPGTDVSGANPSNMDILHIGDGTSGTRVLNGHMRKISYWPQRVINAETQSFSK